MVETVLALLLGITMTVVAGGFWWAKREWTYLRDLNRGVELLMDRIASLESRKHQVSYTQTDQKAGGILHNYKPRTWNEDMPEAETH